MYCPSQSSWLYHPNHIWWGVQSIKPLVIQSSPLPLHLIPLGPKHPPQHPKQPLRMKNLQRNLPSRNASIIMNSIGCLKHHQTMNTVVMGGGGGCEGVLKEVRNTQWNCNRCVLSLSSCCPWWIALCYSPMSASPPKTIHHRLTKHCDATSNNDMQKFLTLHSCRSTVFWNCA